MCGTPSVVRLIVASYLEGTIVVVVVVEGMVVVVVAGSVVVVVVVVSAEVGRGIDFGPSLGVHAATSTPLATTSEIQRTNSHSARSEAVCCRGNEHSGEIVRSRPKMVRVAFTA